MYDRASWPSSGGMARTAPGHLKFSTGMFRPHPEFRKSLLKIAKIKKYHSFHCRFEISP
jgi:hypothetical protein